MFRISVSRRQCDKSEEEEIPSESCYIRNKNGTLTECVESDVLALPVAHVLCNAPPIEFDAVNCVTLGACFLKLRYSLQNISLLFVDNTAGRAGTILYGGQLDSCRIESDGDFQTAFGIRIVEMKHNLCR